MAEENFQPRRSFRLPKLPRALVALFSLASGIVSPLPAQTTASLTAPTGVAASDGAYATKVAITWDAVPAARTYRIFRSTTDNATGATAIGATGSWVYWDATAPAGQTFFYWVRAENPETTSALSASDAGFRGTPVTAPSGPALEPPPEPAGNPVTAAKVALGKALFWDEQLSSTRTIACGTCHLPEKGGVDLRAVLGTARSRHPGPDGLLGTGDDVTGSPGVPATNAAGVAIWDALRGFQEQVTGRSARSSIDAAFFGDLFWDGRASGTFRDPLTNAVVLASGGALESQSLGPILNTTEMAHAGRTWSDVTTQLAAAWPLALASNVPAGLARWIGARTYPELFEDAFGTAEITPVRIAFALASYERTLFSDRTPFDEANAGLRVRAGAVARGLNAFTTKTCVTCHAGVTFSDGLPHFIGVRPAGAPEDAGRFDVTGNPADRGKFITPSLRNVALRGPFMHTGTIASLDDVFRFYDRGGDFGGATNEIRGINLNGNDRADLAALLDTLTDPRLTARQFPFDRPTLFSESARVPVVAGAGVAGAAAQVPRAGAFTPPLLGNTRFTFTVSGGLGGASAVLVIATTEPPLDRIPGAAEVAGRFALTLEGVGAGNGRASVVWSVPEAQALAGTRYYARWYVLDAAAPAGIAASARVEFTLFGEHGAVASPMPATTTEPPSTPAADPAGGARLAGLSARVQVGGVAGTPIAGIVVGGSGGKRVVTRAAGPTLAAFGVANALAAPALDLVRNGTVVGSATGWRAEDAPAFSAVGAFAFASGSRDTGLVTTLAPGNTSAVIRAVDAGTGVALIEVYDADAASSPARLAALSTRAHVGAGGGVLIGGFTVLGSGELTLLVRAVGPGLAPFGVSDPLADPQVTVFRAGGGAIASNDDWGNAPASAAVTDAATRAGAFALAPASRDAALLITVGAGSYTAVVTGAGGATGTALVEVFVAP